MGLENFQIVFDKPVATYFAGEVVKGKFIVSLNSEKTMEKIKVILQGKGFVCWTEQEGAGENIRTEHYKRSETYFSMEKCKPHLTLWNQGDS